MSVSGDNLVVPAEAEEFTRNDLVGFGASVRSFRRLLDQDSNRDSNDRPERGATS
jgi:hypothetical protein